MTLRAIGVGGGGAGAGAAVSATELFPLVTGTAWSSHAPASWYFNHVNLPSPVTVSNANMLVSFAIAVPGATAQASTGSEGFSYSKGFTVFTRNGFGASSTQISQLTTASFGLSASLGYSSTSQVFNFSWVTNTTGGTTSFSTTSNAGNWSNFLSGPIVVPVPFVTSLSQGEYFIAHQHSSTAATSNSALTFLSASQLHIAPLNLSVQTLGGSASVAFSNQHGFGDGLASAVTTNATMAGSNITQTPVNQFYMAFSNC